MLASERLLLLAQSNKRKDKPQHVLLKARHVGV